jgi:hypothetical protein
VGQVSDLTVPGVSDSPSIKPISSLRSISAFHFLLAFGEGRHRQAGGLPHKEKNHKKNT